MRRHADLLLAAALLAAAQIELVVTDDVDQRTLRIVLAALVCGVVALRRRWTLASMLTCAACFSALAIAGLSIQTTAEVVAFLVLVFTVGERLTLKTGLVALAFACVAIAAAAAGRESVGDVVFVIVVFLIPAWLLGRAVRDRNRRVAELERLGAQLEAERALAESLAAEAERSRIAREMHDVLGHSVSLIALQAGAGERLAVTDPGAARATLQLIAAAGRSALDELSGVLEESETAPDLARLVEGVRAAGLEVELHHDAAVAPPREIALAARRIVQEALTNVVKHAGARRVVVSVLESPEAVDIRVEDDGRGTGQSGGTGRGLVGMRERVAVYNGELTAGPRPEGGYAIEARLRMDAA